MGVGDCHKSSCEIEITICASQPTLREPIGHSPRVCNIVQTAKEVMNDSNQRIAGIEAADAEVELSAEDLLGLSAPCASNERPSAASARPQAFALKATSNVAVPSAPVPRRMPAWRVALSFAVVAGAVGAVYLALAPVKHAVQNVRVPPSQLPAATSPTSEGESVAGAPVRFANPFDANEVFEFPAGTSEAEARDAVAEILMERAMERQGKFDARVSSNR